MVATEVTIKTKEEVKEEEVEEIEVEVIVQTHQDKIFKVDNLNLFQVSLYHVWLTISRCEAKITKKFTSIKLTGVNLFKKQIG